MLAPSFSRTLTASNSTSMSFISNMKSELRYTAVFGSAILFLLCGILGIEWTWIYASYWILLAFPLWALVLWLIWQRLDRNRPDLESPLYPNLGYANQLTLLRGGLIALTGGFLLLPPGSGFIAWVPGLLYGCAAILDRIDGFVARKTKRVSLLGSDLDTLFDALGLVVAPLLAVFHAKVHWSFLAVSIAYYLFQMGVHWRLNRGLIVHPLLPSQLRRTLAGFQMGFVALLLLPVFHAPLTQFLAVAFMVPLLAGFIIDWLVVSGQINGHSFATQSFFNSLAVFSARFFQPVLRLIICALLIGSMIDKNAALNSSFYFYILIFFAVLVFSGSVARIGALGIIIIVSLQAGTHQIDWTTKLIFISAIGILLLGSGRFSLWQGDDTWVNRQDGA